SGTVASATNSGVNACGGTEDDDVWYHFVATGPSHTVDLINVAGSTTDLYHAVYGPFANVNPPNCTNATVGGSNISCSDPNSSTLTGLVTGQTYFVQVYSWTSTTGQTSTFDICIGTPPPPPSNDEPCGAIALTVNSTCIGTTGSVGSATNSGIDASYTTSGRSEEHTSELQSREKLVCRLLLEKKKDRQNGPQRSRRTQA